MNEAPNKATEDVHPMDLDDRSLAKLFASKADAARSGYAMGVADERVRTIRAMSAAIAQLERELACDVAVASGEKPPATH